MAGTKKGCGTPWHRTPISVRPARMDQAWIRRLLIIDADGELTVVNARSLVGTQRDRAAN